MSECSILQIEDAMIQKLKELFRDELFQRKDGEKVLINIFNNFIPMKNYQEKVKEKKESEDDIPFILLRYKSDQQTLREGRYDSFIDFEMIVGVYEESSVGHRQALKIVDKIKKEFMEFSNNKNFSIRQDYFKTSFLEEESGGYYWFVKSEFSTYNGYYSSEIACEEA
ncbi:MAG: hypothetical protein SPH94_08505 [Fusobacterium necrophorum]|uniref:hypothetical protein n=1 Tax=Fusobacterium necrophorum TaxID=859 RepID=UPI0010137BAD|nr:hypothetical protein [Fusobacterium necrophorum]MDY2573595.1 hypothetical protein [Fusobacterium necrophorum]MDY6173210.1 hypothetical protein [Fusobacterium necrophorum]RXZ26619.1 hypothetical protein EPT55_08590 [Fusobacterium necrophorum]